MTALTINRPSIREHFSNLLVYSFKPLYYFMRRNRKKWDVTRDSLAQMPVGSLGHDTALFLIENDLQLMPLAEFHDVYHVLFEFNTTMHDETCLQFVPLGNGKRSLPYLASTLAAGLIYPEYWGDYYDAYYKGKNATRFYDWKLEDMLRLPTIEVRSRMFEKQNSSLRGQNKLN